MLWPQTGLKWVATSPFIPDLSAVLGYAMTGLGAQVGGFSHGIGTPYPFRLLRFKGKSTAEVQRALMSKHIPGLSFRTLRTHTKSGASVEGVYVNVSDWSKLRPTEISFYMMQLTAAWTEGNPFATAANPALFNKHVGSTTWWNEISQRGAQARTKYFVQTWATQAQAFQRNHTQFRLY